LSHMWLWSGIGASGLPLFFSLAHNALRQFSRARLEAMLERKGRLDRLERLFEHHEELSRTTALLYILSLILVTVLLEIWSVSKFGSTWQGWLAGGGVAAGLALTLGGVVPMAWARHSAESVLAETLPVLQACRRAFLPVVRLLAPAEALVRRLAGAGGHAEHSSYIEEEIRSVVSEGEREGAIEEDQRDMIESVIEFKKEDVTEIMTPRTDIVAIEADSSPEEARRLIADSGHSRIPVTDGHIDRIVGILYAKDLLQQFGREGAGDLRVRQVMREPLFVPETKKLDELQAELQAHKVHIAIVLDEYGGTAGLVTIEDIIEEVFGEIVDEYEREPPQPIRRAEDGAYVVEARVHINELNHELGLDLPEDEDYETIGGFVLSRLGTIPKEGDVFSEDGLRITVLEAEERRVTRLRIDLAPENPPQKP